MSPTHLLIGCGGLKLDRPAAAYARWARLALDLALVHGVEVVAPLHGLQVGERLSWYRQRRAA